MDNQRLKIARWAAIANAGVSILSLLLVILAQEQMYQERIGMTLLIFIKLALGVYVLFEFKALLNHMLQHSDLDLMIIVNVGVGAFASIIELMSIWVWGEQMRAGQFSASSVFFTLVTLFAIGLAGVGLGLMVLRIPGDLWGMKNFLAVAMIVSGVGYASIIFGPVGILAGVIASGILASVFLRAADTKSVPGARL